MVNQEVILEYTGQLTFSTIGRLLTMLKYKVIEKGIKTGMYKRIISVMIEALENIYKYSEVYHADPHISKKYLPHFVLSHDNGRYVISVSNPVKLEHAESLREKLDLVNSMGHDDLKVLYRHTITNGKFSSKGGAGLGIIEMAKISGNPLQYSFKPINGNFLEYTLEIIFT